MGSLSASINHRNPHVTTAGSYPYSCLLSRAVGSALTDRGVPAHYARKAIGISTNRVIR
jgi:hypothetical protein